MSLLQAVKDGMQLSPERQAAQQVLQKFGKHSDKINVDDAEAFILKLTAEQVDIKDAKTAAMLFFQRKLKVTRNDLKPVPRDTTLSDINAGEWVNTAGKVLKLLKPFHKNITQKVLVGDETGVVTLTAWERKNPITLELGHSYKFSMLEVSEYQNEPELNVRYASTVEETNDIQVNAPVVTTSGVVVELADKVGLAKLCPDCGAVIEKGVCKACGKVKGATGLYLGFTLDTGVRKFDVQVPAALIEGITGLTVESAKALEAERPGESAVFQTIAEKVNGNHLTVTGQKYGYEIQAQSVRGVDAPTADEINAILEAL